MDLNSYAELAVRLVNTSDAGAGRQDELATVEAYRALMADRAPLCARVTGADLDALRELRSQLRLIFGSCAAGDGGRGGGPAERAARPAPRPPGDRTA